jgi:hypothetical protein
MLTIAAPPWGACNQVSSVDIGQSVINFKWSTLKCHDTKNKLPEMLKCHEPLNATIKKTGKGCPDAGLSLRVCLATTPLNDGVFML